MKRFELMAFGLMLSLAACAPAKWQEIHPVTTTVRNVATEVCADGETLQLDGDKQICVPLAKPSPAPSATPEPVDPSQQSPVQQAPFETR